MDLRVKIVSDLSSWSAPSLVCWVVSKRQGNWEEGKHLAWMSPYVLWLIGELEKRQTRNLGHNGSTRSCVSLGALLRVLFLLLKVIWRLWLFFFLKTQGFSVRKHLFIVFPRPFTESKCCPSLSLPKSLLLFFSLSLYLKITHSLIFLFLDHMVPFPTLHCHTTAGAFNALFNNAISEYRWSKNSLSVLNECIN